MYTVVTSDGVIHETDDAKKFVALLDEYGPEVVDHAAPPEQWTDLSRALIEPLLPEDDAEAGECKCPDCRG